VRVVILRGAEEDLREIRRYVIRSFGQEAWQRTKAQFSDAISQLKVFPMSGSVTETLEELGMNGFRQMVAGMNRIVYEVTESTVYIHVISDSRRDARTLLARRLLRAPN